MKIRLALCEKFQGLRPRRREVSAPVLAAVRIARLGDDMGAAHSHFRRRLSKKILDRHV
jgi:hypothetical protein